METEAALCCDFTDDERALADRALSQFESGQYDAAVSVLSKLSMSRTHDPRLMHNKAVAAYHASGLTQTDRFRMDLNEASFQLEKDATELDDEVDEVEKALVSFNQALMLFYLRRYHQSLQKLEKLFRVIEPLEEQVSLNICFLLLETYLVLSQVDKATQVVAYLDKLLVESRMMEKFESMEMRESSPGASSHRIDPNLLLLHHYKARLYVIQRSMKACKREIKVLMDSGDAQSPSILYLKAELEYVRQNYRKSIRVLNSSPRLPVVLETGECLPSLYFNNLGCIHAGMKKHNLAAYYFKQALEENSRAVAMMGTVDKAAPLTGRPLRCLSLNKRYELLHNLGTQLLCAGIPLEAFDCILEAVQVFHTNPRLWLKLAECCVKAREMEEHMLFSSQQSGRKSVVVQGVVGTGPHRKIVVASPSHTARQSTHGQSAAMPTPSLEFANICLRNAWQLLPQLNSATESSPPPIHVEQSGVSGDPGELVTGDARRGKDSGQHTVVSATSMLPMRAQEINGLRSAILACSSYVALGLGDYVSTLEYGQQLFSQPKLPGLLRYLGHIYVAEALVSQGRITEAVQHLSPETIVDVGLTTSANEGEKSNAGQSEESIDGLVPGYSFNWTVPCAKMMMFLNLATAFCLRKEFDKARRSLQQATSLVKSSDTPPQAVLLAVYIELQTGNVSSAVQLLKKNQTGMSGRSSERSNKRRK